MRGLICFCFLFLVSCVSSPIRMIDNRVNEPNIMAFQWRVTLEEAARAQKIFPELGGVLFLDEYDNAEFLDAWVAVYQGNGAKLKASIEAYGEPNYILIGTDEANTAHNTSYVSPKDFAQQLRVSINALNASDLGHIPVVSAGLAPKYGDFDWIYWYEVEKHFDVNQLYGIAFNANKTSIDTINSFIDYFAERSQFVVLQPAPFNDGLNRATGGSEHIRTFYRLSQSPEVLSVNVWTLYDRPTLDSKGFLDSLDRMLYTGIELKQFYNLEIQRAY